MKKKTDSDAAVAEAPKKKAAAPQPQVAPPQPQAPDIAADQQVETAAYVPQYKVKPEFKEAVLQAIGQAPFNQIAGIMNAINVETMDHNTLTQIINVLGNFPYTQVAGLLTNVNQFVEQIIED